MAKKISFHKMVASGNDFVVIDHRRPFLKNIKAFAKKVCDRNFGIGGDGLLLMEKSKKADIKMRIFNPDGSEAEMCGNGARCAGLYARSILGLKRSFSMETCAGVVSCQINRWTVKVALTPPKGYKSESKLKVNNTTLPYHFINTGVPHVVSMVKGNLDEVDVKTLGRAIRGHEKFKPKGANVNFVYRSGPKTIRIRTYERGVEAETLACGTGSTAGAIVASLSGVVCPPVEVKTKSGEVLKVNFKEENGLVSDVTLEGNAEFTFEGSMAHAN
jgi:diaminopimelate epimerase